MKRQPPNIPDFKILDLELFNSIQSLQNKEIPNNVYGFIEAMEKKFTSLSHDKLDNVFFSLRQAMIRAMFFDADNTYNINHMGK